MAPGKDGELPPAGKESSSSSLMDGSFHLPITKNPSHDSSTGGGGGTSSSGKPMRRQSSSFHMFKGLECKEEFQKLRLAGFLREVHKIATEETKEKVRQSIQSSTRLGDEEIEEVVNNIYNDDGGEDDAADPKDDFSIRLEKNDLKQEPDPKLVQEKVKALLCDGKKLHPSSLMRLLRAALRVLSEEPTVLNLRKLEAKAITVVGDLHGSLKCLRNVLHLVGLFAKDNIDKSSSISPFTPFDPTNSAIVFCGDYVDRGDHSLEVLCTLLLFKLTYPKNVYLLRGNHEDTMTASVYGFQAELENKYISYDEKGAQIADALWHAFGKIFASFPLIACTTKAAMMHGGIPMQDFRLSKASEIDSYVRCQLTTVVDPKYDDELLAQEIMWSDPTQTNGIYDSDRGAGCLFGPDIARQFLDRYKINYIIRAHEPCADGYKFLDIGDGRGVITIFSTSNYPNGTGSNLGAVLYLDEINGTFETVPFSSSDDAVDTDKKESEKDSYLSFLGPFVNDNKRKLSKAFREVQDENDLVTTEQWAQVIAKVLELPDVPWLELQPELAPTIDDDSDMVDWIVFVHQFSKRNENKDLLEENQLSFLHEHKDKFLKIYQLLDIDGSGTVSKEEFITGIKTLNEQIPIGQPKLEHPEHLFHIFDVDGDGEISIEEFCKGLEESATLKQATDSLKDSQVETLQENHEMLLVAFRYLDTDKNGTIDRNEFNRGIEIMNQRMNSGSGGNNNKLGNPEELFDLLDLDKNGVIDLNEFDQMLRSL